MAAAVEKFIGKWKFQSTHGSSVGVVFLTEEVAGAVKLTREVTFGAHSELTFEVAGEHWKMISAKNFTTWSCEFDLGKEFEMKTADGRTLKTIFTFENGKLIEKQTKINPGDDDSYFEYYIDENGKLVIVTMESGGVKAKQVYTKA